MALLQVKDPATGRIVELTGSSTSLSAIETNTGGLSSLDKNSGVAGATTLRTIGAATAFGVVWNPSAFTRSGTSAAIGQDLTQIDLNTLTHRSEFGLFVVVATNATAPGVSRSVTMRWQFSPDSGVTNTAQFRSSSSLTCSLLNSANGTQRFHVADRVFPLARYLYVWFDYPALDSGAQLTISPRLVAS